MRVTKNRITHPSVGRFVIANFTGYKGCAVVTQKLQANKSIKTEELKILTDFYEVGVSRMS